MTTRVQKWKKRLFRWTCILALFFFLLPLLSLAMPESMKPAKTKTFFADKKVVFRDTTLTVKGRPMRFVCTGNDTMPLLLFIHGSPGSWDAFKDYLADSSLRARAFMVSPDRAGYGGSGKEGVATLSEQVELISAVLTLRKNQKPITIVGHSYGGPVAVRFAIDYPAVVKQLILISPVISPSIEENIGWKRRLQKMSQWWGWRWAISNDLKNSTREMQPLPDELRKMEPYYVNFRIPVTELHGTKDPLAPYGNQEYVKDMLAGTSVETITYENESHFFVWSKTAAIIQLIGKKLDIAN